MVCLKSFFILQLFVCNVFAMENQEGSSPKVATLTHQYIHDSTPPDNSELHNDSGQAERILEARSSPKKPFQPSQQENINNTKKTIAK